MRVLNKNILILSKKIIYLDFNFKLNETLSNQTHPELFMFISGCTIKENQGYKVNSVKSIFRIKVII